MPPTAKKAKLHHLALREQNEPLRHVQPETWSARNWATILSLPFELLSQIFRDIIDSPNSSPLSHLFLLLNAVPELHGFLSTNAAVFFPLILERELELAKRRRKKHASCSTLVHALQVVCFRRYEEMGAGRNGAAQKKIRTDLIRAVEKEVSVSAEKEMEYWIERLRAQEDKGLREGLGKGQVSVDVVRRLCEIHAEMAILYDAHVLDMLETTREEQLKKYPSGLRLARSGVIAASERELSATEGYRIMHAAYALLLTLELQRIFDSEVTGIEIAYEGVWVPTAIEIFFLFLQRIFEPVLRGVFENHYKGSKDAWTQDPDTFVCAMFLNLLITDPKADLVSLRKTYSLKPCTSTRRLCSTRSTSRAIKTFIESNIHTASLGLNIRHLHASEVETFLFRQAIRPDVTTGFPIPMIHVLPRTFAEQHLEMLHEQRNRGGPGSSSTKTTTTWYQQTRTFKNVSPRFYTRLLDPIKPPFDHNQIKGYNPIQYERVPVFPERFLISREVYRSQDWDWIVSSQASNWEGREEVKARKARGVWDEGRRRDWGVWALEDEYDLDEESEEEEYEDGEEEWSEEGDEDLVDEEDG